VVDDTAIVVVEDDDTAIVVVEDDDTAIVVVLETGIRVNVAVAVLLSFMSRLQVPVPVQAPLQPVKVESPFAAAVRTSIVPLSKSAVQVEPQVIPVPVTVPVPIFVTVSLR
jgi:hypothetical protein